MNEKIIFDFLSKFISVDALALIFAILWISSEVLAFIKSVKANGLVHAVVIFVGKVYSLLKTKGIALKT